MDLPSPYVWAGTDQYKTGKYVADGRFDPNVVDSQLGCAGMLLAMAEIDRSVAAGLARPQPSSVPTPPPSVPTVSPPRKPPGPAVPARPVPPSLLATLLSLIARLFRR
jgi:hypothetical protein